MRITLLLLLMTPVVALAQREELENPGAYEVVQERDYRLKHELAVGVGYLPLDAFYKGVTVNLSYAHHFSDHIAWRVGRGTYSANYDTGLKQQLEREFGVLTTPIREVQWMAGSDLILSPFYGKTAFLNRLLVHFQIFIELGVSIIHTPFPPPEAGSTVATPNAYSPGVHFGGGIRWFAANWFSVRLDITNEFAFGSSAFNVPMFQLAFAFNFAPED